MKIDYELIGKRVRHRRRALDYTQDQLAVMAGLSKTHVSNIENAHSVPSVDAIVKIAEALDVTPDVFLLGLSRDKETDFFQKYVQRGLLCSHRDQQIIANLIDSLLEIIE